MENNNKLANQTEQKNNIYVSVERLTDGEWVNIEAEYDARGAYPLQINDTLDETLDNAEFEIVSLREELYPKFSKYRVMIRDKQGDSIVRYYFGNDSVKQFTYCKPVYYKHAITLIEPTTMLQRLFVYGKSFTQPTDSSKVNYYIDDMIRILLEVTPLHPIGTPQTYYLDESIAKRLHAVTPVEFSWSNRVTLYEALQDIGYAVGGIPRLIPSKDDDRVWNVVTFDFYEDDQGEVENLKRTDYNADLNMDYCASDLVTSAENVTTNIPITVPSKDGWVSVRNESTKVTDESSYIELPSGIEKIKKVEMFVPAGAFEFKVKTIDANNKEKTYTGTQNTVLRLDITDWVVSSQEFDLLQEKSESITKAKDCVFTWAQGDNKITNISEVTKSWLGLITIKVYEKVVVNAMYGQDVVISFKPLVGDSYLVMGKCESGSALVNGGEIKFRVEYYPTNNNVVFTTRKTQRGTNQINQIAYNQSAEVVSADKLGKNARATAKRVGNAEKKISSYSQNVGDLPKCGQTYHGYKLTNVSYQVSDVHKIDVLLELSENYTRANERIAVDRRYRQFAIPQDYVQRKIHRDYYISLDRIQKGQPHKDISRLIKNIFGDEKKERLTNMYIFINGIKLVPTCNRYLFGNSMMYTFTMASNMVAGRKRYAYIYKAYKNADIYYCNSDGRVNEVEFGLTSDAMSDISKDMYPETDKSVNNVKFLDRYKIYKDAGEQLSFEIQIHFVSDDFIITPHAVKYAMFENPGDSEFRVIRNNLLGEMLSEKDMVSNDIEMDSPDGDAPIIRLTNLPKDGKGWAFTTNNGEIVVGQIINTENIENIDIFVSSY